MLLVTEILFTEEIEEDVYLEPGKVYLFSYPVNEEGWEVEQIEADEGISTEKWEYQEPGKVSIKVETNKFICTSIKVHMKNKLTGETKLLICQVTDKPVLMIDIGTGSLNFNEFTEGLGESEES